MTPLSTQGVTDQCGLALGLAVTSLPLGDVDDVALLADGYVSLSMPRVSSVCAFFAI
jgi:hypothetical protein